MNKELQDKAWAVLPNEFREEVKKMYNNLLNEHITPDIEDSVNNRMLILEEIFSYHNLTSDTEGEEMLIVPRKQIQNWYQEYLRRIDILHGCSMSEIEEVSTLRARCALLTKLFGYACLPDKKVSDSTPGTNERKFKGGDYVTVHFENGKRMVGHINEVLLNGAYDVDFGDGCMMHNVTEACIELCTEPHNVEDETVSKPTHLSDMEEEKSEPATSALPIRLQVATAAMQGLLNATSVERFTLRIKPSTIAKAAVEYADALLAECGYGEEGGEKDG